MYCSHCGKKGLKRLREHGRHYECSRCGFRFHRNPVPAAAALIIRKGKILLTKRAILPKRGYWDVPGGICDWGEHPEKTLHREMREELGIHVRINKFLGAFTGWYPYQGENVSTLSFYYIAAIAREKPQPKDEIAEIRWFPLRRLPKKMAFENDRKAIKALLAFRQNQ